MARPGSCCRERASDGCLSEMQSISGCKLKWSHKLVKGGLRETSPAPCPVAGQTPGEVVIVQREYRQAWKCRRGATPGSWQRSTNIVVPQRENLHVNEHSLHKPTQLSDQFGASMRCDVACHVTTSQATSKSLLPSMQTCHLLQKSQHQSQGT